MNQCNDILALIGDPILESQKVVEIMSLMVAIFSSGHAIVSQIKIPISLTWDDHAVDNDTRRLCLNALQI